MCSYFVEYNERIVQVAEAAVAQSEFTDKHLIQLNLSGALKQSDKIL